MPRCGKAAMRRDAMRHAKGILETGAFWTNIDNSARAIQPAPAF
jgi:hypothetical protein